MFSGAPIHRPPIVISWFPWKSTWSAYADECLSLPITQKTQKKHKKNDHPQLILCSRQPTRDQPVCSIPSPRPFFDTTHPSIHLLSDPCIFKTTSSYPFIWIVPLINCICFFALPYLRHHMYIYEKGNKEHLITIYKRFGKCVASPSL